MKVEHVEVSENAQITFDRAKVDEKYADISARSLFLNGTASFGNELQDAVALNYGIDDEGRLDMDMLVAAEAAEVYLEGRQGQPLVIAEFIHRADGQLSRVHTLVGVLSDEDKLIGTFKIGGWNYGGIALKDSCYAIEAEKPYENLRKARVAVVGDDHSGGNLMPLRGPTFSFGKTRNDSDESDRIFTQEIVAGDEIMQWLRARFGEGQAGYEMFTGLLEGVREPEAQAYLLQEPYVGMLMKEQSAFKVIGDVLSETATTVDRYKRASDGALAEAELAIAAAAGVLFPTRVPFTGDSDRTSLTANLSGLHDIEARRQTVAKTSEFLRGLIAY